MTSWKYPPFTTDDRFFIKFDGIDHRRFELTVIVCRNLFIGREKLLGDWLEGNNSVLDSGDVYCPGVPTAYQ
jgi:hypothetical protein